MDLDPITPEQLLVALRWRYATKAFDPQRKIPANLWSTLEQTLVLAPSSFGLQPYRFLVVDDPSLRERLLPHAWNQRQVIDASHFVVFAARTNLTEAEVDTYLSLTAQIRGTALESLQGLREMLAATVLAESFAPRRLSWATFQAYIALAPLMTGAALLGIDTCPLEGFVPGEFDRLLDLGKEGLNAVVCCALGYRDPRDKYASLPKVRYPADHLIRHL
jgi:nitroreductase